jgi:hypothetical protein
MKNKILFLTITSALWVMLAHANLDQYKEHSVVVLSKDSQGKMYVGSAPVGSTVTISQFHEEASDYFIASDCECTVSSESTQAGMYEVHVPTLTESYVHFTLQIDANVQILKVMIVKNNIFERSFFNVRTVAEFDGLDQAADDLDFLLEEGSLSQEPFTSATQVDSDITTSQKIMFAYALFMLKSQEFIEKSIKESVKWFDSVMDL